MPTLGQWEFVVGGGELVEDLRRAGSEELSFHQGIVDVSFALFWTLQQHS